MLPWRGWRSQARPGPQATDRKAGATDGLRDRFTSGNEQVVMVIYLPGGNGADAARLAPDFFLAGRAPSTGESPRSLTVELFSTRTVKASHSNANGAVRNQPKWIGCRMASGSLRERR